MKILFISHDASRTGAPLLLLTFQKWIKNNTSFSFSTLLRYGGELEKDFRKEGPTEIYFKEIVQKSFLKRIFRYSGLWKVLRNQRIKMVISNIKNKQYDIIYSNTIVNLDVLNQLKSLNIPIIIHVRELETTINHFGGKSLIEKTNKLASHFIADSEIVKENLVKNHNIESNKVSVIHEYFHYPDAVPNETTKSAIKASLNIPHDAFIIGACGGVQWRKGYDLFIQLAVQLTKHEYPFYFVWIGNIRDSEKSKIEYDIKHTNLKERIHFVGKVTNPLDYISTFNVFTILSREEPFGLVGLEASFFKIPVISFEKVTGFSGFAKDNSGITVPYLDIQEVGQKILILSKNPIIAQEIGENAYNKLPAYSVKNKSQEILNTLEHVIKKSKSQL